MSREYDYLFKLVIVGNSGVGKSSVLLRYADDMFNETYLTTIGVDFKFKTINIEGKKVKMQIWDTAGQERFRTITSAYYKGADAIVLVYETTSSASFADIDRFWINEVESYAEKDVEQLLLGNKSDADKKQVDYNQAKEYAEKKGMEFFEVSAKTADNVQKAFSKVAMKLMEKKDAKTKEKKASRDLSKGRSKAPSIGKNETNNTSNSTGTYSSQNSLGSDKESNEEPKKLTLKEDTLGGKIKKAQSGCCGN
jgi:Ras-related protein Rab-1A